MAQSPQECLDRLAERDSALANGAAPELDLESKLEKLAFEDVKVQSKVVGRGQRQLTATIPIPHTPKQIWPILTDYEGLADFVPSLVSSQKLAHPEGGIRVEQVGTERLLRLNFSARVVLDITESFPEQIRFQMVEGDFRDFSGCWQLNPNSDLPGTELCYNLLIWPKRTTLVRLIESRLKRNVALNLVGIRQQVAQWYGANP